MRRESNFFAKFTIFIGILFIIFVISNYGIKVSKENVISRKIGPGFSSFKILQISDLHSAEFGDNNSRLIRKIDNENPDIIVMTGDMVSTSDTSYDVFYSLASNLASRYPTYYIVGNHEQNLKDEKKDGMIEYLSSINIRVLDNEKVTIENGNEKINLYGMWFNLRYYKDLNNEETKDYNFDLDSMVEILGEANKDEYNIVLTHNPVYADTYSQWGADLVLSGHLHGGMVYVPFVGGLFSPEKEWFPKYYGGRYSIDNMDLIVNKGLGNGQMGFRVFNTPEISTITLTPE